MRHPTTASCLPCAIAWPLLGALAAAQQPAPAADVRQWRHHGECWILTDAAGAALPASASVADFPLLLRLRQGVFDFAAAQPHGEDLRITDDGGAPLDFEVEQWDAAAGVGIVWVRVPKIVGDARQRLRLHWGNPEARSVADGRKVFGAGNGYVSALHLDPSLRDAVGTVQLQDQGTATTAGRIGAARRLDGSNGLFGGDAIQGFPKGAEDSTTEAWFRPERVNTTVLAWGQEQRPGKVMFNLLSPPRMAIQCYFADVDSERPIALGEWVHVVHTYRRNDSRIYIDGVLAGAATPLLDIPAKVRLHIGGWHGHGFRGDVDEVRVSNVARSPEWIRLQYENQRALPTLVGPLVAPGDAFATSVPALRIAEGGAATVTAQVGGALKYAWLLQRDGEQRTLAVDEPAVTCEPGRVAGDQAMTLLLRAVFADGTRTLDVPITVAETIPDPEFTLTAPARWDGRTPLRLRPDVTNATALAAADAAQLRVQWQVDGLATVRRADGDALVLERAQRSGAMTVRASLDNGGAVVAREVTIQVDAPARDAWVAPPVADDLPESGRVCFAAHRQAPRPEDPVVRAWLAVNCIREWRGDSHFALLLAEDLSRVQVGILHDAHLNYGGWIPRSRGADDAAIAEAMSDLESRGLASSGVVNERGRALRTDIERRTDELCTRVWRALGEASTMEFLDLVEPVGPSLLKRIDDTAGPDWMPAARERRP